MKPESNKMSFEIMPESLGDGLWQAEWAIVSGTTKTRHYSLKKFTSAEAAARYAEKAARKYLRAREKASSGQVQPSKSPPHR